MLEWGCAVAERRQPALLEEEEGRLCERSGPPSCLVSAGEEEKIRRCTRTSYCFQHWHPFRRERTSPDILPMEQNTSFSARSWIINQRTKRAFKRVYLSIVAHPKWKCLWWYIYENTIFMMIVGMNVYSSNKVQSFHFLPQRNTGNKTFFNHDAQVGIFFSAKDKARQLILLWKKSFLWHFLSV